MFKRQTRRIKQIIILWALLWLILSLFFLKKEVFGATINSVLQGLINTIEGNEPTEKLFEWDAMVENIYKKAINGKKRKTANITNIGIEKIQFINSWVTIEKEDLLNILYNSNNNVNVGIRFLCKTCKISPSDINKSYEKVILELEKTQAITTKNDNVLTRAKVDERINSQFIIASNGETALTKFNEATVGEDLFINGVEDDSDYDLQIDIENIGNLLFESFIAPIETVFYKLPPNKSGSSSNNNVNTSTDKQDLINILQNTLTSPSINTWVITNWWWQITNTSKTTNTKNTPTTNTPKTTNQDMSDTEIADTTLQKFVDKNTLTQKATTQLAGIEWDICREWVSAGPITPTEEQEENINAEDLDTYLSTIQWQIETYDNIYPENQYIPNITNNPAFNDMTPSQTNQFIEQYIEDLFKVESTESCIKNCSSLPLSERTVCQIQCLCFTMSWPKDPDIRVKSMNEMLKLRFCMVPAKSMAIPKWKNIYSLDDILTRIETNMGDLVNWWDMVKFQKTKEFLDNPIAEFSFSKLISFQINLNMKPIFNNKSAIAKKDQKETSIQKLEKISWKEQTVGIDTNKYLVVQDNEKNKVYKKYAWSVEEYQNNYEQAKLIRDMTWRQNVSIDTRKIPIVEEEKSKMLTIIVDFLEQNLTFREQTEKELQNLNNIVFSLQSKL